MSAISRNACNSPCKTSCSFVCRIRESKAGENEDVMQSFPDNWEKVSASNQTRYKEMTEGIRYNSQSCTLHFLDRHMSCNRNLNLAVQPAEFTAIQKNRG